MLQVHSPHRPGRGFTACSSRCPNSRISDAYKYVFHVRKVRETLRDLAESSMRKVVGDHSVSEVLTIGREAIQAQAKEVLQHSCDRFGTGIHIEQLVLQDVNPPTPVRDSFNEVNQAIQERVRAVNQATPKMGVGAALSCRATAARAVNWLLVQLSTWGW